MDHDQERELELETLQGVLDDLSAEPIKISYGVLKLITDNFSNEIGRGGFGVVYQGVLRNGAVAVKKSYGHSVTDKQFMDEIKCLRSANHKNIVRFLGYCADTQEEVLPLDGTFVMAGQRNRLICLEFVQNGNIRQYLEQGKTHITDWPTRYRMIRGICQGLQYLHDRQISHLDLKPENVMLDAHKEAKITDFGLSKILDQGQSILITQHICGTLRYIAPEVIDRRELSFKSDLYALGIIMIELLTGISMISLENWDESLHALDCRRIKMCTEIARRCTDTDKNRRPTINEVNNDLEKLDLDELESMIPRSSINEVTTTAFPGTQLLDVYPLELRFATQPNQQQQEMECQVSMINKTNGAVGFFVLPNPNGIVRPINGILMPISTRVFTLTTLTKGVQQTMGSSDEVHILMFIMKSGGLVGKLMKCSVDEKGVLIMSTDDLYEKVQEMGGEIHRTTLKALVVEHRTWIPTFMDAIHPLQFIKTIDVHPTNPWVLVLEHIGDVYIWDYQLDYRRYVKVFRGASSAKFIARKQWFVVAVGASALKLQSIYVYTCPSFNEIHKLTRIKAYDEKAYDYYMSYIELEIHPSRSLMLSYGENKGSEHSMKVWDWGKKWSCTQTFNITPRNKWSIDRHAYKVMQVMFNPKDPNSFFTLGVDKRVKIWKFDCPDHIAILDGLVGVRLQNIFTYSSGDRHLVATVTGPNISYHIWDLQEEKIVHTLSAVQGGYSSNEKIVAVAWHPTRPVLVTASNLGHIHVWDHNTYRLKKVYANLGRSAKYNNPMYTSRRMRECRNLDWIARYIAFVGSTRLVIAYERGIDIMDIDPKLVDTSRVAARGMIDDFQEENP